jgi:hypothetical protein
MGVEGTASPRVASGVLQNPLRTPPEDSAARSLPDCAAIAALGIVNRTPCPCLLLKTGGLWCAYVASLECGCCPSGRCCWTLALHKGTTQMKREIAPYLSEWQKAVFGGVGVEAIRSVSPTSEKSGSPRGWLNGPCSDTFRRSTRQQGCRLESVRTSGRKGGLLPLFTLNRNITFDLIRHRHKVLVELRD